MSAALEERAAACATTIAGPAPTEAPGLIPPKKVIKTKIKKKGEYTRRQEVL